MLTKERIARQLSHEGYRLTRPRRAVIQVLLAEESYLSPAEIQERARTHYPSVGLVTVYRTLNLLSQLGFVRRIHTGAGCHGYAAAQNGHRHHLVCRSCGAVVEFEGCDLSSFEARISQETGFAIEDHILELSGVCATCQ